MTWTVDQMRDRLGGHFQSVEQVNDTVLRFTRSVAQRPFAVYYVDISDHLPTSPAELTSYQDRVIGKQYFDGNKSLQWSNYLFFVVSASDPVSNNASHRQLIEQDRSYARKFVVTEGELESAIEPLTIAPADSTPEINILSLWTDQLERAGLAKAVLSDDTLPRRLSLIEKSITAPIAKAKPVVSSPIAAALPQLRSLVLSTFRDFPKQRRFDFGTVNLIVGANGM